MGVSWGVLSTARINDWVLGAVHDSEAVEFVAVGGRDRQRTERWAAERGVGRAHGSYEELLADDELEAVYISLPNGMHVEWTLAALQAGKHVLCEKPLTRDPERAAQAAELAEREGLVLAEAFMYRYHPQTAVVRKLVADGRIGELRHVEATLSFPIGPDRDDARLSAPMEGGALMDVGCYCVSAARLYAGEPEVVFAEYSKEGAEVDMRVNGMLRSATGVTAGFDGGMSLPRRDRLELVGSEGTIVIEDPWHCRLAQIELRRPPVGGDEPPRPGEGAEAIAVDPDGSLGLSGKVLDAYRFELEAISGAIAAGQKPEFGGEDAVAQAAVIAALHESACNGEPVRLAGSERSVA